MAGTINVEQIAQRARDAGLELAGISADKKVRALKNMAQALRKHKTAIKRANGLDRAKAQKNGLSSAMIDRLMVNDKIIEKMAKGLEEIAGLRDPVGKTISEVKRPGGFKLIKKCVPLGVIAIIYESRPNVTADAAGLCMKSGNAVILKGGSEALQSNAAIAKVLSTSAEKSGIPKGAIAFIATSNRAAVQKLLTLDTYIDVVIPRGGEGLIRAVAAQSTIPVIKHYKGVCHVYVDNDVNLNMAEKIVLNAKVERPGVCNAMETLLLHKSLPKSFVQSTLDKLRDQGVEIRGDAKIQSLFKNARRADKGDWTAEYLELILAVKMVNNCKAAIDHINTYGSKHTDAIVCKNNNRIEEFISKVDSSSVMVNASTRLSDGGVYGLGAEVGISTDKLHARGPMGIEDLTTYKWIVKGNGTLR